MITEDIIKILEVELTGLTHGVVNLEISIHDSKPKFRIVKQISFLPGRPTSGCEKHEK